MTDKHQSDRLTTNLLTPQSTSQLQYVLVQKFGENTSMHTT